MERRYLSPKELSEYSGYSKRTISRWVSQREIPFIKKKRLVKFDKEEIDKWLKKDKIKCMDDF